MRKERGINHEKIIEMYDDWSDGISSNVANR